MQRWMAAKMEIAKRHGITVSGAGRALGHVFEDRKGRRGTDENREAPPPPVERERHVTLKPQDKRKPVWGSRKERRDAVKGVTRECLDGRTIAASSIVTVEGARAAIAERRSAYSAKLMARRIVG